MISMSGDYSPPSYRVVNTQNPQCPYGDKMCPKVESLDKDLKDTKEGIKSMNRLLYVIAGILTVQLGIGLV